MEFMEPHMREAAHAIYTLCDMLTCCSTLHSTTKYQVSYVCSNSFVTLLLTLSLESKSSRIYKHHSSLRGI